MARWGRSSSPNDRDAWTDEDVEFLVQVASQIAIAVENSLVVSATGEMKERLATEKLYLEDEIRLDYNIGNMVGEGPAFQSVLKGVQIVAPTDATVLILGRNRHGKGTRRPGHSRVEQPQQG
jgi:formate hydrogenlyase transcriptional activator